MNATQIFNSYEDFLNRSDSKINGVSAQFAEQFPEYKKQNESNEGCWNCRSCSYCRDCSSCSYCRSCSDCRYCSYCSSCSDCSSCSYCSYCSYCSFCSYCSSCSSCSSCSDCSSCSYCSYCRDCSSCSYCSSCVKCSGYTEQEKITGGGGNEEENKNVGFPAIPVIENIHQKVLEAVQRPKALNMWDWHQSTKKNKDGAYCGTTHCRAGWVVALAGAEGVKLEEATNTEFAAKQIYKASSPIHVSPLQFFESNENAMKDIERCAAEEKALA